MKAAGRSLVVSIVAMLALTACSDSSDNPLATSRADAIAEAQDKGAGLTSVLTPGKFENLQALQSAADRIVVATQDGTPGPTAAAFDPKHPWVDLPMRINQVIKGPGKPGASMKVTAPGQIRSRGGVRAWQLADRDKALLFLTTGADGREFVVGAITGQYDFVEGVGFVKIDPKNPSLPDVLTVQGHQVRAG